ncbi:hypothetical protein [Paenibacillus phytorum]|uniref:hypothetical protein n=1 Tax=Paenibacillus phytorum TaxID=2654977 RepID=UPI001491A5B6|nr:hypothetical protein [Paenibacillus phytorum]
MLTISFQKVKRYLATSFAKLLTTDKLPSRYDRRTYGRHLVAGAGASFVRIRQ